MTRDVFCAECYHRNLMEPRKPRRPGPGRPPHAGDPPARVHVTVSSTDYDRAYEVAQRRGISIPQLLRRGLRRELAKPVDDE